MKKKAFMKTVEILLVIIVTTIFLMVIFPKQASTEPIKQSSFLTNLEQNNEFREFVMNNNGCFNSTSGSKVNELIERYIIKENNYLFCSNQKASALPLKRVTIETLFIAGNITSINFKTVRLYYWSKTK